MPCDRSLLELAASGHCGAQLARAWWGMSERCLTASDPAPLYVVTVRGLVLMASIGITRHEREQKQRVRVSVDLTARPAASVPGEDRRRIINYAKIVATIRQIAAAGHIDLCEGLAERICNACLADDKVERVRVWVEKLDVIPETDGVGAILERTQAG